MFTQLFGSYLLNNRLVSIEQLRDAMETQKNTRLKVGVMAVNSGFMTADQVNRVHDMQAKMDKKFGELAIEMGFLDDDKLQTLLSTQKSDYLQLGQAMVDKGYMTLEQFEKALNGYKSEHNLTSEQFKSLQNGEVDEIMNLFYRFEDSSHSVLYKSYTSLLLRNIIRFIDSDFRPLAAEKTDGCKCKCIASQQICGEVSIYTAISAGDKAFTGFASKYAGEQYAANDEYVQAAAGEFLNLVNGLFLVNMSNNNIELELTPQEADSNKELTRLSDGYRIPLEFSFGRVEFIISKSKPVVA